MQPSLGLNILSLMEMNLNGLLVKLLCFSLNDRNGILRTVAEASPQAIAERIRDEFCLALYDLERTLGTVGDAKGTPITFFVIDPDDLSCCHKSHPLVFHFNKRITFSGSFLLDLSQRDKIISWGHQGLIFVDFSKCIL